MMKNFTEKAKEVLRRARRIASKMNQDYVGTEHLLISLIETNDCVASGIFHNNGIEAQTVYDYVLEFIPENGGQGRAPDNGFSPGVRKLMQRSIEEARKTNLELAGTEHLLIALLLDNECFAARVLYAIGAPIQRMYLEAMLAMGIEPAKAKNEYVMAKGPKKQRQTESMLDQYSRDLTAAAREGRLDPLIGRSDELQRVIQTLSRRQKNNPCLVGEPGVGKTAIVEGLAQRIVKGTVPGTLARKRLLAIDLTAMVAGTKYRGEFEERIKNFLDEVREDSNILLFIDELHTIIGAGGAEGAMDASNILKPSLSRGEIQLIGATTREEYRKYIEKDAALERRFQPIAVEEPTQEETVAILNGLKPKYEEFHNVIIRDDAIEAAASMAARYISDRFLPDKAIDLLDEAGASLQLQDKKGKVYLKDNDIARVVAAWTKIPLEKLSKDETSRLRKLESILHRRVVGQEDAVTAVAKAVRRGRVGLKDPNRPIGSFLFLGPTGVGKTELSKALAEAMFGSENAMIRVDMSEYMEKHSVSKMIGSPPGYVGHDDGGQLSEKVRRSPYSVVLFDEIEKAHEDVFNILLQVLDDGHITDAQGRRVDFKNTIIIMTSNAGAQNIITPKLLGFSSGNDEKKQYSQMKSNVMEEVKRLFKPEFLNRIDEIIVFHMLQREHMKQILDIMLKDLTGRAQKQSGIAIRVSAGAKDYIMDKGYDEKYGARPLRRALQTELEDLLSDAILSGEVKKGDKVTVHLVKNALSLKTE